MLTTAKEINSRLDIKMWLKQQDYHRAMSTKRLKKNKAKIK